MEHIQASRQEAIPLRGTDRFADQAMLPQALSGSELLWANLLPLRLDAGTIARNRIVTTARTDPSHATFDMLRTKVLQAARENNWTSIAITSPTRSCGKTFVATNLAFSLSHQKDCRSMLIDLDLRRPQIGNLLGMSKLPVMEKFLKGQSEARDVFVRYGDNLAIGANGQSVQFAAELLQSGDTARVLEELKQRLNPQVILFDLPPMYPNDDVMAFLPNVDCVLIVAAAEHSTCDEVGTCEQELFEKTNVLGVVLNKCRYGHGKYER